MVSPFDVNKELIFSNINQFNEEDREDILHNLGGVVNHELYFLNMSSNGRNIPFGSIKTAIDNKYGNFDNRLKIVFDENEFLNRVSAYLVTLEAEGEKYQQVVSDLQVCNEESKCIVVDYANLANDTVRNSAILSCKLIIPFQYKYRSPTPYKGAKTAVPS